MESTTQTQFKFTEGQDEAYAKGREYILGKLKLDWFWITGAAGTGKTTITRELAVAASKRMKVCISAPTGKAISVLRSMLGGINIDGYRTPHSLLGLRDNESEFEPDFIKAANVAIKYYDLIIFDEFSMLPSDMFDSLMEYQGKCKYIFVGDIEQLKPVKGTQANITQITDRVAGVALQEVVRQGLLSPITRLATHLKTDFSVPPEYTVALHEGHGTYVARAGDTDERTWFREMLIDKFTSREYREDPNYARVICATVNTTAQMNKAIRGYIYGDDVHEGRILIGESLISNGRHVIDGEIVLTNNEQMKVVSYTIEDFYVSDTARFKIYNCMVLMIDQGHEINIRILHEDSQADFNLALKFYKNKQTEYTKGSPDYGAAATNYKALLSMFAMVDYNYACTCHKAQGSTYNTVFILLNNLLQVSDANWDYDEKRRWLYTALTRASKDVILIV
jgi:exodeoxyribonuclease-5